MQTPKSHAVYLIAAIVEYLHQLAVTVGETFLNIIGKTVL